jgi:hypothetical protein
MNPANDFTLPSFNFYNISVKGKVFHFFLPLLTSVGGFALLATDCHNKAARKGEGKN